MPATFGVIMGAVHLPSGDPVIKFSEVWPGARGEPEVDAVINMMAENVPVMVTDPRGAVLKILGPDAQTVAFVVRGLRNVDKIAMEVPEGVDDCSTHSNNQKVLPKGVQQGLAEKKKGSR